MGLGCCICLVNVIGMGYGLGLVFCGVCVTVYNVDKFGIKWELIFQF